MRKVLKHLQENTKNERLKYKNKFEREKKCNLKTLLIVFGMVKLDIQRIKYEWQRCMTA